MNPSYAEIKSGSVWIQKVHPQDRAAAEGHSLPALTLCECLSTEGDYTLVRRTSMENPYRILTSALSAVVTPSFMLGQAVLLLPYDPPENGTVYRIERDIERGHEVYNVIRDGRVSSRRYLLDEMRSNED